MPKNCLHIGCTYPVFSKMLCMYHWRQSPHAKPLPRNKPLAQTTDGKPAKVFKIAPISKSRQEALKTYRRRRDKYFEEHPECEFPGCNSRDITLHHKRGRVGAFLTDKRHFCSLCHKHHRFVEENPLEAYKLGLSQKRLDD